MGAKDAEVGIIEFTCVLVPLKSDEPAVCNEDLRGRDFTRRVHSFDGVESFEASDDSSKYDVSAI